MVKHVETLLTNLGITPEDIAAIDAIPEADQATFDSKPYAEKVKGNYQTQFKNDPAFFSDLTFDNLSPDVKKKFESTQYGRAATITRDKLLKGLGMTEADYADLTPDEKEKLELFVPAIAERFAKSKSGDKEIQAQLIEARKKLEGFEGYEETVKTKYEGEANVKIGEAIFNAALIGELSAIPGLKISASDIAKTASDILRGKFAFERVNDFGVELRQKANPAMKVLKGSTSQELTLKEALLEIATERGWVEAKKDEGKGGGKVEIKPDGKGGLAMLPPHLQNKISQKIAAEA